ncbi:MAG: Chemotaxis phosphatase, CheZ [Alphaproteobacteria bacterium ADurb.Bin438]|nr:MAG: Chemotaxis phosphatase, CheZ [Alphaproteobacteria bacterium ADurb.Bin438]
MENKLFSAEKAFIKSKNLNQVDAKDSGDVAFMVREIRQDIKALAKYIRDGKDVPTEKVVHEIDEVKLLNARLELEKAALETEKYKNETNKLKSEITQLSDAINQTKNEIAALSPASRSMDRINSVSSELDEIVMATEDATQNILDKAEKIDNIASAVIAMAGDNKSLSEHAHDISELVVGIYESCNFQDLTGQRITKAVKALKFIDEKISNMITIWGEDVISELAVHVTEEKTGDARLLNGPTSGVEAISQDEIDRLFD